MSPVELHSAFGFGNRSLGVFHRASTPSTFVMLRGLKFGAGSAQMLERAAHMRLIGADSVECRHCN